MFKNEKTEVIDKSVKSTLRLMENKDELRPGHGEGFHRVKLVENETSQNRNSKLRKRKNN